MRGSLDKFGLVTVLPEDPLRPNLSGLPEEGISIRTADMPGADDLMMRVYAAMAQKERELFSERTRAALAAARARGAMLWGEIGAGGRLSRHVLLRRPNLELRRRPAVRLGLHLRWRRSGRMVL